MSEVAKFVCKRCKYEASMKGHLKQHLMRKKVCVATDAESDIERDVLIDELGDKKCYNSKTFDCEFCGSKHNSRSNKSIHLKTCKYNPKRNVDTDNYELQELREHIKKLESKIMSMEQNPKQSTTIGTQNNIANQHNHIIVLNNMGEETMKHINNEFLMHCLMNANNGVGAFLEKLHFDKEVPENKNIRIKSHRDNILEKYSDNKWVPCDKNSTIDDIIRKGYKILFQFFLDNKDDDEVKEREEFLMSNFIKLSSADNIPYYQLRRKVYMMIYKNTFYVVEEQENENENEEEASTSS